MKVNLHTITPNIENTIVEIARASSSREDKTADATRLINYLIRNKHWSPFEHGFLTFEIITSKAIAIQLLRHRSNYFQEFSQRYQDVNKLDGGGIYEPVEIRLQAETNRQSSVHYLADIFESKGKELNVTFDLNQVNEEQKQAIRMMADSMELAKRAYNKALSAGIAKECARFVLPMTTKTRLYVTMNVRSVIHWLDLRDDEHAQKEIQEIAWEVKNIFKEQCPEIAAARGYFND